MRILITGSRDWADALAIRRALFEHARFGDTVVHGGARGADTLAGRYWEGFGPVEVHPADWDRHGKAAGHRRNAEMVALGADICLAFPLGESRGTRGCMVMAAKAGIRVVDHDAALRRPPACSPDAPATHCGRSDCTDYGCQEA